MKCYGIKKDSKTNKYYIDTTIKLCDGSTFHYKDHYVGGCDLTKISNVKKKYYECVELKRKEKNKEINSNKEKPKINKTSSKNKVKSINTLTELFESYCKYRENEIKTTTINGYKTLFRDCIKSPLKDNLKTFLSINGTIRIKNTVFATDRYNPKRKKDAIYLAKQLISYARTLKIINTDKKEDLLEPLNAKIKTEYVTDSKNKYTPLSDAEKVFNAAESEQFKTYLILLYFSGLRIGEFLGMQKGDIEFGFDEENCKYAKVKIQRQKKSSSEVEPWLKNGSKVKYIYYFNDKAYLLEKYIKENNLSDTDFIISISRTTFRRKHNEAMKDAGVPHNTLHGFGRKSINTEMYNRGADSKARSTFLGQESTSVNEQHYIEKDEALNRAKEVLKTIK